MDAWEFWTWYRTRVNWRIIIPVWTSRTVPVMPCEVATPVYLDFAEAYALYKATGILPPVQNSAYTGG